MIHTRESRLRLESIWFLFPDKELGCKLLQVPGEVLLSGFNIFLLRFLSLIAEAENEDMRFNWQLAISTERERERERRKADQEERFHT